MTYTATAAPNATPTILTEEVAWRLLQALAVSASRGAPVPDQSGVGVDERGALRVLPSERGLIALRDEHEHGWDEMAPLTDAARELLDLYVPLCAGAASATLVLAHLGQSLDGRVATVTGASRFVTGPEDLRHAHRLRALFDAVLIGTETARLDDPELTTRLVPGRQPTRVVLDPHLRLDHRLRLLSDGRAPTIVITARTSNPLPRPRHSHVEIVAVTYVDGSLDLEEALAALRERGLARIFIEGGGVTVSRFLEAGLLDRLQLAIAPKIMGSGALALNLPPIERMADVITTRCRRFSLGADMLFDCDLRANA